MDWLGFENFEWGIVVKTYPSTLFRRDRHRVRHFWMHRAWQECRCQYCLSANVSKCPNSMWDAQVFDAVMDRIEPVIPWNLNQPTTLPSKMEAISFEFANSLRKMQKNYPPPSLLTSTSVLSGDSRASGRGLALLPCTSASISNGWRSVFILFVYDCLDGWERKIALTLITFYSRKKHVSNLAA